MRKHLTAICKEWLTARLELLEAEKQLTRRSDELAQRRQELPWDDQKFLSMALAKSIGVDGQGWLASAQPPSEVNGVPMAKKSTLTAGADLANQNADGRPICHSLGARRPYLSIAVKVASSAVAWFLAVMWLNLGGGPKLDVVLDVVLGMFVMLLTLILFTASMLINDIRWSHPRGSISCSLSHCRY